MSKIFNAFNFSFRAQVLKLRKWLHDFRNPRFDTLVFEFQDQVLYVHVQHYNHLLLSVYGPEELMHDLKDYLLAHESNDYLSCVGLRNDTSWTDGFRNAKQLP